MHVLTECDAQMEDDRHEIAKSKSAIFPHVSQNQHAQHFDAQLISCGRTIQQLCSNHHSPSFIMGGGMRF